MDGGSSEGGAKGGFAVGLVVATIVAMAGGSFFGMHLGKIIPAGKGENDAANGSHEKPKMESGYKVVRLAPILVNVANPADAWVRVEASALFDSKENDDDVKLIVTKLTEDFVAYLKTVALSQIEGPSGFQHLREDLDDRARIRSDGKIKELVVESFVIE